MYSKGLLISLEGKKKKETQKDVNVELARTGHMVIIRIKSDSK